MHITVHAQFTPQCGYQQFVEMHPDSLETMVPYKFITYLLTYIQSNFLDYANSLTFPRLWAFL